MEWGKDSASTGICILGSQAAASPNLARLEQLWHMKEPFAIAAICHTQPISSKTDSAKAL